MPGRRQTTLQTIARQCRLSVSTVSRILSGQARRYRISVKTEQAVLREAERLEFAPNQLARGLRLRRTHTLGLLIPDISNPFFAGLARHVEIEARQAGYSVFLCDTEERTDLEVAALKLMQGRKVDGILISPVGRSPEHLVAARRAGLALVVVDRSFPAMKLPFVTSDNFQGARDGVAHLVDHGHRDIACIQGLPESVPNRERVRGYRAALEAAGLAERPEWILGDAFSRRSGYIAAKLLLQRQPRPTALFSAGNLISLGVLQALNEGGLRVPEDLSLVSFDEQPYSAFLATPMTTIAQQSDSMGQIAVRLLLGQIAGGTPPAEEGIQLPTRLIPRASVRRVGTT